MTLKKHPLTVPAICGIINLGVWILRWVKGEIYVRKKEGNDVCWSWVSVFICFPYPSNLAAADPIVGTWNYSTSGHWSRGPVPAGKLSQGTLVITQSGDEFKMEFKSGMVFSPPELKYLTGKKNREGLHFFKQRKGR